MNTTTTGTTWGLIEGRHPLPVTGYVITEELSGDPRDIGLWEVLVHKGMARLMAEPGPHAVIVTGLTPVAMLAVAWAMRGEPVALYQPLPADRRVTFLSYDRLTGDYLPIMDCGGEYVGQDVACDHLYRAWGHATIEAPGDTNAAVDAYFDMPADER